MNGSALQSPELMKAKLNCNLLHHFVLFVHPEDQFAVKITDLYHEQILH